MIKCENVKKRKGASYAAGKVRNIMNEILKLQVDLIKEMQKALKIVQEEMENEETVTYRADKASTVLVRLAITFEKTQPKYITLDGDANAENYKNEKNR